MHSLSALGAEFAGLGTGGWPVITRILAKDRQIHLEAADGANFLWAFGTLIGNSDMHNGNLSFISEHGRPYSIALAYDMTPMPPPAVVVGFLATYPKRRFSAVYLTKLGLKQMLLRVRS
ncbi:MAG: hypothetical protein ABL933_14045 [Methyloglobulus sp.]